MASKVRKLNHVELKCEPSLLYIEIELDRLSSIDELVVQAHEIISSRLSALNPSQTS